MLDFCAEARHRLGHRDDPDGPDQRGLRADAAKRRASTGSSSTWRRCDRGTARPRHSCQRDLSSEAGAPLAGGAPAPEWGSRVQLRVAWALPRCHRELRRVCHLHQTPSPRPPPNARGPTRPRRTRQRLTAATRPSAGPPGGAGSRCCRRRSGDIARHECEAGCACDRDHDVRRHPHRRACGVADIVERDGGLEVDDRDPVAMGAQFPQGRRVRGVGGAFGAGLDEAGDAHAGRALHGQAHRRLRLHRLGRRASRSRTRTTPSASRFDDEAGAHERWPDSVEHDALFAPDGKAMAQRLSPRGCASPSGSRPTTPRRSRPPSRSAGSPSCWSRWPSGAARWRM